MSAARPYPARAQVLGENPVVLVKGSVELDATAQELRVDYGLLDRDWRKNKKTQVAYSHLWRVASWRSSQNSPSTHSGE